MARREIVILVSRYNKDIQIVLNSLDEDIRASFGAAVEKTTTKYFQNIKVGLLLENAILKQIEKDMANQKPSNEILARFQGISEEFEEKFIKTQRFKRYVEAEAQGKMLRILEHELGTTTPVHNNSTGPENQTERDVFGVIFQFSAFVVAFAIAWLFLRRTHERTMRNRNRNDSNAEDPEASELWTAGQVDASTCNGKGDFPLSQLSKAEKSRGDMQTWV